MTSLPVVKKCSYVMARAALLVPLLFTNCGQGPAFIESEARQSSVNERGSVSDFGKSEENGGAPADGKSADSAQAGKEDGSQASAGTEVVKDTGQSIELPPAPRTYKTVVIEKSYNADVLAPGKVMTDLDQAFLMSQTTLRRTYTSESKTANQVTRQRINDMFVQGYKPSDANEQFLQVEQRPLDIVVVVDNSGSMVEEQKNLSQKLAPLLSYVANSDWQIGVVTTDPDDDCLQGLIKKSDANAAQKFANAVTAGTKGSSNERGVLQAFNSIKGNCLTQPWVRSNSTLAVLIVSDEDNCSDGTDCGNQPYKMGSYLTDYLSTIRELGKNARIYGLVWHPTESKSQCTTGANQANIYAQMIADTGGTWGSICAADYSQTLSEISKNIAGILNGRFTLKQTPNAGSLHVFVNDSEVITGFTLTKNVIAFTSPPAANAKVKAIYNYDGKPITDRFTISSEPLSPDAFSVTINGAMVNPADYMYGSTTNEIVFDTPPADRANVSIVYKRNDLLKKEFPVNAKIKSGTLKVYVNNVESTDYTYVEQSGKISFNDAPPESAVVRTDYVVVGDPIYGYPFTVSGGAPQNLTAYEAVSMVPITITYVAGNVIVAPPSWAEGRQMILRYHNPSRDRMNVALPNPPILSTLKATDGVITCMGANKISLSGQTVVLQNCGFADASTSIDVSYTYVSQILNSFVFDVTGLPSDETPQTWKVFVNNGERQDYAKEKTIFSFPNGLGQGSVVRIQLSYKVLAE